ncbi:MAG: hypothetical protein NVS9B10_23140 [Nevskia sp.]
MPLKHYVTVLLLVFLGLSGLRLAYNHAVRLGCWSGGYAQDGWMAYCNSTLFGVFDPDAIWFDLEPEVAPAVRKARVLSLSDSYLQNALSLGGASEWFSQRGIPTYFLGLPAQESGFGEKLIDKFQPEPAVLLLAASPYFTGGDGIFVNGTLAQPAAARQRALELKGFESFHESLCAKLAWACNHNFAYFRSRADGHWIFPPPTQPLLVGQGSLPNDRRHFPTNERPDELKPVYPQYLDAARRLVGKLKIAPECVVIAHVPTEHEGSEMARFIAGSIGATLIDPNVERMETFDRAHLTPDSARRWTAAFLQALAPLLEHCLAPAAVAP